MKAAAMSVWIFINLLCFGMCGYLYLIWSQYWMSIERQRLFTKTHTTPQKTSLTGVNYQTFSGQIISNSVNVSIANIDAINKKRRSIVAIKSGQMNQINKTYAQIHSLGNVVLKLRGSPRFPNIHKPVLEFDTEKYSCDDYTTPECETRTREFKELLLKEFHRVLMSESKVFTSGLDSQNTYDVKYYRKGVKEPIKDEILCALNNVTISTITANDQPFKMLGYNIPKHPLQEKRVFNSCAVVTSAGALRGSRLGEFIDSHDMVLRFNNAPTENYTDDVGSKTTFRILNSQVVTKPEFKFLDDPLFRNVSILIWDPANYSSNLEEWYQHPDFPLFPVYKRLLEQQHNADVHLLNPQVLWHLWSVLQDFSPYRLRRNPPSSGFIGLWFAIHRCHHVRMFEYVPSVRATRRCHYHVTGDDAGCTLGTWHPLAQEKALAHHISVNSDLDIFQRGFIEIPGLTHPTCKQND